MGWVGRGMGFSTKAEGRPARLSPQQPHHTRAMTDVKTAKLELCGRRPPVRTRRQRNMLESDMTGLEWTGPDQMAYRTGLESGNWDWRMGIGRFWGRGLTFSTTGSLRV